MTLPDLEKYRTFWRRVWAGVVDVLLLWPLSWVDDRIWDGVSSGPVLVAWYLVYSVSFPVYSILCHGRWGQTLGKRLTGVTVLDVSESKLSMKQAFIRDAPTVIVVLLEMIFYVPEILEGHNPYGGDQEPPRLKGTDMLLVYFSALWFAAEVLTMLTNAKRRAVHDFIARSVVVKTKLHREEIAGGDLGPA